jgi:hypothetical protein
MSAARRTTAVRQETQDVPGKLVAAIGGAAVLVAGLSVGAMAWILESRKSALAEMTVAPTTIAPAATRPLRPGPGGHNDKAQAAPGLNVYGGQRAALTPR